MADAALTFKVEDATLWHRNFRGAEGRYNQEGEKGFSVVLQDDVAEKMLQEGWNVRYTKPREEGDVPIPFVPVAVGYKIRPPRVVLITPSGKRTQLDESSIAVLDWADIREADLICRSFYWTNGDKSGLKAYLQTLIVTINEDELEAKYKLNEDPPSTTVGDEDDD